MLHRFDVVRDYVSSVFFKLLTIVVPLEATKGFPFVFDFLLLFSLIA